MVLFVDLSNGTIEFLRKHVGNLRIDLTIQMVIFNEGLWLLQFLVLAIHTLIGKFFVFKNVTFFQNTFALCYQTLILKFQFQKVCFNLKVESNAHLTISF